MSVPQRIAMTLPQTTGVTETLELARWAEAEGYDDVWFADNSGIDALTTAAGVAVTTDRCRIGTAIIPVFTRTPAVFASTSHVLHELSGGRFILGLGSSSQTMMENWHGQKFEKPLTRVRETAQLVRSMLAGEKSDFSGSTLSSSGYRQLPLDSGAVPIYMAALRGKMLEAAAEFGDGVIVNLFPKGALPRMMEHIRIGAERAGKKLEDIEIVCRHQVIVTDDKESGREAIRKQFTPYYATPVYNDFLAWSGYEGAAQTIAEGWAEKNRQKTASAMTGDLVDEIAIIGSAEECQDGIRERAEAGITTHIISCVEVEQQEATKQAFTGSSFSF
jgi:probable F420-dependent oxidoreductase